MLPLLLFGIWQVYCFCCWWVVLGGYSLLWHVGYMQIFCHPPAIKLLHLYAKKLLGLFRIRHRICLPLQFSWSSAFSHKPTLLLIMCYICISACKIIWKIKVILHQITPSQLNRTLYSIEYCWQVEWVCVRESKAPYIAHWKDSCIQGGFLSLPVWTKNF